jgi:hypothetical protein
MKKTLFVYALLFAATMLVCKAQEEKWMYRPGSVTFNDGTTVNGLVRIYDTMPWYNQRYISFIDSAAYAANPKVRGKKYRADDMQQYKVDYKIYDKVHYVNIENLQLKSLGRNDHMMERLCIGQITAHRFYDYPPDTYGEIGTEEQIRQSEEKRKNDLLRGYKVLCVKDGEKKQENAFDIDLLKYLAAVPAVQKKYQEGGYGNQPIVEHKGLAAKMLAMAKKAAFKQEEADAIVLAFNDYNAQTRQGK